MWRGRPSFSILGKGLLADFALPACCLRAKLRRPAATPGPSSRRARWRRRTVQSVSLFTLGGEDCRLPNFGGGGEAPNVSSTTTTFRPHSPLGYRSLTEFIRRLHPDARKNHPRSDLNISTITSLIFAAFSSTASESANMSPSCTNRRSFDERLAWAPNVRSAESTAFGPIIASGDSRSYNRIAQYGNVRLNQRCYTCDRFFFCHFLACQCSTIQRLRVRTSLLILLFCTGRVGPTARLVGYSAAI